MRYRSFGRTGWKISEISFGAWQIGGHWGPVDDGQSVRTLLTSYDHGINFVDTAELYGRSEHIVGASLRQWRGDKIYVATKARPLRWPDPDDPDPQMSDLYSADYLRKSIENSLRCLGVERLDLFQLHCWVPSGIQQTDWLETLHALQSEGKIDRIGVSLRDYKPDEGVELAERGWVDSIQVIFNIFEQRPTERLFPAASRTKTAIINRVALDSGSLSGTWTPDTYASWDSGSQQRYMFRGHRFAETLRRVEDLKKAVAPWYPSLAEAAFRFVLSSPEVSTVIAGMSTARNIARNVGYSTDAPFPAELRKQLAEHGWLRNYYK